MARSEADDAVARALLLIARHPQVESIQNVDSGTDAGSVVDVVFNVNLASQWRAIGQSPTGVYAREVVRYAFPRSYPLDPPVISLRDNFDRRRPHMQPFLFHGRPVPCICDQPLVHLLHAQGLAGVLNQTALWLDRAAANELIDPAQGWEPSRRDSLDDVIIADAAALRQLVRRTEGHAYLPFEYIAFEGTFGRAVSGSVGAESTVFNRETVPKLFEAIPLADVVRGRSVALVIWPGKNSSGEPIVSDEYTPEDVVDIAGLRRRAAAAGCQNVLAAQVSWIERSLSRGYNGAPITVAVVLCIRRPFHLIGIESNIELSPYMFEVTPARQLRIPESTAVRPAAHNDVITVSLLQRMSGDDEPSDRLQWTLLGAGSIGSKLALHLTRAGRAPTRLIDSRAMRPHNAARHALIPSRNHRELLWARNKVGLLEDAIAALDQTATSFPEDAVSILQSKHRCRRAWPTDTWAVVNATGSIRVREALSGAPIDKLWSRVIELALFSAGAVGWITIEGPNRNPSTGDLAAEAYAVSAADERLRKLVQNGERQLNTRAIGEGCGSTTMVMSDGRLSMFAASMGEAILHRQRTSLASAHGEILLGAVDEDGVSLVWTTKNVEPVRVGRPDNSTRWRIRVHSRAHEAIEREIARWPGVETGGIIIGRVSEASRTFNVTDVLPAPPDTKRSASEFVLGTEGVPQMLREQGERAGWTLYCLGTWHSHLGATPPSDVDKATAVSVALARLAPSLLLISTPAGYRGLVADPASAIAGGYAPHER